MSTNTLTVNGLRFGASQGSGSVVITALDGTTNTAEVKSWSAIAIEFYVPVVDSSASETQDDVNMTVTNNSVLFLQHLDMKIVMFVVSLTVVLANIIVR